MPDLPNPIHPNGKNIRRHLEEGDPVMWHRIIMSITVAIIGLLILGGIILEFINDRQVDRLLSQPLVNYSSSPNSLPEGEYAIYQVYLDTAYKKHYLVSSMHGGAVVSVAAPEGTKEPEDILAVEHYDAAAYLISVDADKNWKFVPTTVYDSIQKKLKAQNAQPTQPAPQTQQPQQTQP